MRGANLIKIAQFVIYIFNRDVENKIVAYWCLNLDFGSRLCKSLILR